MAKPRNRWIDGAVYFTVRTVVCAVQAAPLDACLPIARALSWLAYDVLRIRRSVIDDNLRHAFPDFSPQQRRRIGKAMWQHLLIMAWEVAHAPRKLHPFSFGRHLRFTDRRLLVDYLLQDRPVVLVSGHFGTFELAGFFAGMLGFPVYSIARKLDNPYLDRWIAQFRESQGQFLLDKNGCATTVAMLLQRGATLGVLGDQHAGHRGLWVDFLGRPASSHKAVALFTLTSGAPQLVVYLRRTDRPLHFELGIAGVADPAIGGPQLDNARTLTQWYNARLGEVIRQWPEQYWWVHRRWKGEPPAARRRRSATRAA